MATTFSHSRLSLLDDCPRRYAFRYVEDVPEEFQTADAVLGSAVHEAIQWMYTEREARREPSAPAAVERFRAAWKAGLTPDVKVVQDDRSAADFARDGEDMVRRHHGTTFAGDRLTTLAIEPKIRLDLSEAAGTPAAYVGFIDRLARDAGGTLHVVDYKTSRRVPASPEAAGTQLRGYGLAILEEHGGTHVELRYEYVRAGKHLAESFSRAQGPDLARLLGDRIRRALAAEKAGEFPARPGPLCRWCGYRGVCDASAWFRAPAPVSGTRREASRAGAAAETPGLGPCPDCGSPLRLRVSSRSDLVACSRYPDCAHARPARPADRAPGRGSR